MTRAVAVGFSCVDVYENINRWYPTGNGIDWGVHLSRLGISVAVVSAVGKDEYGKKNERSSIKREDRCLTVGRDRW